MSLVGVGLALAESNENTDGYGETVVSVAKAALRKALRTSSLSDDDFLFTHDPVGAPALTILSRTDYRVHLSITHDAGVIAALVVVEAEVQA